MRIRFLAIVILSFSAVGCQFAEYSEKAKGGTVEKIFCCYWNSLDLLWESANA